MGQIGSELPIVRCTNHVRVLNLSFGGELRESGPEWESDFAAMLRPEELSLELLLPKYLYLKVVRIRARDPAAPPELLDLSRYYNGSLDGWLEGREETALSVVRRGLTMIDGVSFDVRGVIQLGSMNYPMCSWPASVTNLEVGLRCEAMAFLQGTVSGEGEGQDVGRYIVHFEDGSTNVVPITYGLHLLDWKVSDPEKIRSWDINHNNFTSGKISVVQKGGARLYVFHWTNPQPNLQIEFIDFVSAMTQSSPFLVAISAVRSRQVEEKSGTP
jgi:hypothetical protein